MEFWLLVVISILLILIFILLFKLFLVQKTAREIETLWIESLSVATSTTQT